jgi:MFS family permease
LTPEERAIVTARLEADGQQGARDEKFQWSVFWESFADWKTWTGMVMYMGVDGALYAFSLFLPSVIFEMGYTATKAQLMSVAPYAVACFFTVVIGFYADRYGRGIFNIGVSAIGAIGFLILAVSKSGALSYFATFLGAMGIYVCIPNTISWVSNNCDGVYRRGVTVGAVIAWGNLNGVVSSNIYRQKDAPWYRMGHWIVFVYLGFLLFGASVVNYVCLRIANRKRGGANGRKFTL